MTPVLVDSSVLIDLAQQDSAWRDWSAEALARAADSASLVINPLIYAEVSVGFASAEELDHHLPDDLYRREALPWEAAFLAGQCFVRYRRRGGSRTSPLPDFYIGSHAAVLGYRLLTRDPRRYRGYFATLELVSPNEA
jgi:predicted nucleic acid-binding protein